MFDFVCLPHAGCNYGTYTVLQYLYIENKVSSSQVHDVTLGDVQCGAKSWTQLGLDPCGSPTSQHIL